MEIWVVVGVVGVVGGGFVLTAGFPGGQLVKRRLLGRQRGSFDKEEALRMLVCANHDWRSWDCGLRREADGGRRMQKRETSCSLARAACTSKEGGAPRRWAIVWRPVEPRTWSVAAGSQNV